MVRYFFHANTERYRRRLKSLLLIVIMPLLTVCVFCTVNIVLHLPTREDYSLALLMLIIITGCVAAGILFTFSAVYFTEKLCRRHSRYTYFDILPNGMVYSEYAGEFVYNRKREVYRRLSYIPFAKLEGAVRDPKTNPCAIRINGEIHSYFLPSRFLGYHVSESGDISFDLWELNERGFELSPALKIKDTLGSTKALEAAIAHYAEIFRNRPAKKPFDISEHIQRRNRKKPVTSNPAFEVQSYDRKW